MKIVLINPPVNSYSRKHRLGPIIETIFYNSPPLGLCYLAAVLEKKGIPVKIIDAAVENLDFSVIIKRIRAFEADIIGITSLTNTFYICKELARSIKNELDVPIIIGGQHVSANPEEVLSLKCFDVGVLGEGEITFSVLIDAIEKGGDLREVEGIVFLKNSEVYFSKPRDYITNLEILPFPARHLIPLDLYVPHPNDELRVRKLSMVTSRGCPYGCIFCDKSIFGSVYRSFSPEYIVSEMEYLVKEFSAKDIAFVDSMFAINTKKIKEVISLIKKKGLDKLVSWTCTIRANTMNRQLLSEMKDAGCWRVRIGIESGNQKVLDFIRKDITKTQVRDVVGWADKAGLQPKAFFILGHLVDTKETIKETIQFAKSLPLKDITVQLNTPLSKTVQYGICKEYGKIIENDLSAFSFWQPVFVPRGLSQRYLIKMLKKFYRSFYLRPITIYRHMREWKNLNDIKKHFRALKLLFYLFFRQRA